MTAKLGALLPILLWGNFYSSSLLADNIYKSIDENGNVSYSSSPKQGSPKSVKIDISPAPSDAAVNAAKQRHQQNVKAEKTFNENRQQRTQQISEENRIKREKSIPLNTPLDSHKEVEENQEQGPYYGIPGHGILVLPKGPRINR